MALPWRKAGQAEAPHRHPRSMAATCPGASDSAYRVYSSHAHSAPVFTAWSQLSTPTDPLVSKDCGPQVCWAQEGKVRCEPKPNMSQQMCDCH